jgi:hypothetical protein
MSDAVDTLGIVLVSGVVTAIAVVILFASTCGGALLGGSVGAAVFGGLVGLAIVAKAFAVTYRNLAEDYTERAERRRVMGIMLASAVLGLCAAWLCWRGISHASLEAPLVIGLSVILLAVIVALARGLPAPRRER